MLKLLATLGSLTLLCSIAWAKDYPVSFYQHLWTTTYSPDTSAPAITDPTGAIIQPLTTVPASPSHQHHHPDFECGTDELQQKLYQNYPKIQQKAALQELLWQQQVGQSFKTGGVHTIPVVVHLIHNNGPANMTNNRVQTAIQQLNAAFANTGYYNPATGVDTEIQFCLAQRDSLGNLTTGITRTQSSLAIMDKNNDDLAVKNLSRWNPREYINIWVVDEIIGGVAGYAYLPSAHGTAVDGIVLEDIYMGLTPAETAVLVHEMGHYLGLYHTFEGGCTNNNCVTDGDKVCDTPPDHTTARPPCSAVINSCTSDEDDTSTNNPFRPTALGGLGDQPDQKENYMDYSDLACYNAFTQGQADRMHFFLHGIRASLLQSQGCLSPCSTAPIVAGFTASATTITAGTPVTFTNTSSNANNYTWSVGGVVFSIATNSSYNFPTVGTFWVKLEASNADPNCGVISDSIQITVFCAPPCGEICDNGIDDDGNGQIDCLDSTCDCAPCSNKRSNIWYFGRNAGLDFNSGSPVPIHNGQLNTIEGAATVNDENGNLLFYTDGRRVWNRNHQVMANGTGLAGHISTSQVVIVPKPTDPAIYYIFIPTMQVDTTGLSYSTVDLSLNNNLGAVTSKNVYITNFKVTEGITAIKHCNNKDFWLISKEFETNRYAIFEVNSTGVNPNFLSQNIGRIHLDIVGAGQYQNSITAFRGNAQGDKLAILHRMERGVELLDFDKSTGTLSNPIYWNINNGASPYGLEFAPNGRYLYVANFRNSSPHILYQYDLINPTATAIENSGYILSNDNMGALQLAPDGKIYKSRYTGSLIDVIHNPNAGGAACNYQSGVINVSPASVTLGLPNFIKEYVAIPIESFLTGPTAICTAGLEQYTISDYQCNIDTVIWQHSGVNSINSTTDSTLLLNATVTGTDTLMATLISPCTTKTDTLIIRTIISPAVDLGPDTSVCQNGVVSLNSGGGYQSCVWQDNSQDSIFTATESGKYWVTCTTFCGNVYTDTIEITIDTVPVVVYNDTTINTGDTLYLPTSSPGGYQHQWTPNYNISCDTCALPHFYPIVTTTYYHVMTNSLGCVNLDSFTVTVVNNCAPVVMLDSLVNDCGGIGGYLQVQGANGLAPYNYQWSTGDTTNFIQNLLAGDYYVTLTDASNCVEIDTFSILTGTVPTLSSVALSDPTCGGTNGSVALVTTTNTLSYLWSTGDTTASINNLPAGTYTVTLTSPEGCTAVTFHTLSNSNAPNIQLDSLKNTCGASDGYLQVQGTGGTPPYSYQWSIGSSSTTLQNLAVGTYYLTLTDASNCVLMDSFVIDTAILPQIINAQVNPPTCQLNNGRIALNTLQTQSFSWSIGDTTTVIDNLGSGRYTIVLTSTEGCITSALYVLIDTTSLPVLQVDSVLAASCDSANGSITLVAPQAQSYRWSTGDTTPQLNNLLGGTYGVTIEGNNGCENSLSVVVPTLPVPSLAAYINAVGMDSASIVINQPFSIGAGAHEQGVQYTWQVDVLQGGTVTLEDSNLPNTTGSSTDSGFYQLRIVATDETGCSATDTVWLQVQDVTFLGMPTAFTPNGDGINDFYRPANLTSSSIKAFRIYNRWGQLVYEGTDTQEQWDGTYQGIPQPSEVYLYYLEYEWPGLGSYQLRGEFSLIR